MKLELVDRTIGWIAQSKAGNADWPRLIDLIGKYPVAMIDYPFPIIPAQGSHIKARMEIPPSLLASDPEALKRISMSGCCHAAISMRFGSASLDEAKKAALAAHRHLKSVSLKLPDASKMDAQALDECIAAAWDAGISSIIFCDGQSVLSPQETFGLIRELVQRSCCAIEFCPGNKYGLAAANAFAALKAGVRRVHTCAGGLAPSGAAMEEVLFSAKRFLGDKTDTKSIAQDCGMLLRAAQRDVPSNKAIIGEDIFAHESGIHVDGVMKNPALYEAIEPSEVGLSRRLVVGKHSGRKAIRGKLLDFGVDASDEAAEIIMHQVKRLAEKQKRALADSQLLSLYAEYAYGVAEKAEVLASGAG
ncbi:MAG: hypothetical protein LBU32_25385 [Clostridiales bacterium]|nr:hypothetical protein [Clostridiales bacterium]